MIYNGLMSRESFIQIMKDGTKIAVNRWIPQDKNNIKAVIFLSHGMQEYALRYDEFGNFLSQNGFVFSAHDHRGHGQTSVIAQNEGTGLYGHLADKDGYQKVTSDLFEVFTKLKNDYPDKKIILYGHSFGSFIAQNFIETYGDKIQGCILTGSSGRQSTSAAAKVIAGFACLFGKRRKSELIQNIAFAPNNKRIKNPVTKLDWLSANPENVKNYIADPFCGGVSTVAFFYDLSSLLCKIHKKSSIRKIPSSLPVLLASGEDDPICAYGKTLRALQNEYKSNGINDCELHLYKGDRHEIFFENDYKMIFDDLLDWINRHV